MGWEQREERRVVLPAVVPQPSEAAAAAAASSTKEPGITHTLSHTHLKEFHGDYKARRTV